MFLRDHHVIRLQALHDGKVCAIRPDGHVEHVDPEPGVGRVCAAGVGGVARVVTPDVALQVLRGVAHDDDGNPSPAGAGERLARDRAGIGIQVERAHAAETSSTFFSTCPDRHAVYGELR